MLVSGNSQRLTEQFSWRLFDHHLFYEWYIQHIFDTGILSLVPAHKTKAQKRDDGAKNAVLIGATFWRHA